MIHRLEVWLLLFVCTSKTQTMSLLPTTSPTPPTCFPDPTTSTPMTSPPPTTPAGCVTYDGTALDIRRGEYQQFGCQFCYCDNDGIAYCYHASCMPGMCVDPVPDECCPWCPNGNNCYLPSGEILPEGEMRIYENMACQCRDSYNYEHYYDSYYYNQYDQQAICYPLPTTPDPCEYATCMPLLCVDAETPPGGCCPECLNGNNCYLPSGEILPEGEIRMYENMVCQCRNPYNDGYYNDYYYYNGQYGQQAVCYPIDTTPNPCDYATCMPLQCVDVVVPPGGCCPECLNEAYPTTPPVGCLTSDGNFMYPGEEKETVGPGYCHILICTYDSNLEEMWGDCIPAMCVDALFSGCCPSCPNGQNCKLPNGNILYGSEPQEIDGMVCQCPEQSYEFGSATEERHITAKCTTGTTPFLTTTEAYPTTPPLGCLTSDGNFMYPGEEKETVGPGYCHILRCTYDSNLEEMWGDCIPAMCVDARFSGCCPSCPNGQNCKLPNGNILYGSEPQEIDGMVCQCPEQSYEFGSATEERHITAKCTTGTTPLFTTTEAYPTTPPLGCLTSDGNFMYPGEEKMTVGPGYCHILRCTYDSNLEEISGDCIPAMCVDAQISGCCPSCPNGQNCRLPNGSILHGSEPQEIDGMVCKCPETSYDIGIPKQDQHVTAECYSASTVYDTTRLTTT